MRTICSCKSVGKLSFFTKLSHDMSNFIFRIGKMFFDTFIPKSIDYYTATLVYDHANGRFLQSTHFSYSKEIITSRKSKNCNSKSKVWWDGLLCNEFLLNLIVYFTQNVIESGTCHSKCFIKPAYHTCPLQSPTSLDLIKNGDKILVYVALSFS